MIEGYNYGPNVMMKEEPLYKVTMLESDPDEETIRESSVAENIRGQGLAVRIMEGLRSVYSGSFLQVRPMTHKNKVYREVTEI
jgi:hypothetical protein